MVLTHSSSRCLCQHPKALQSQPDRQQASNAVLRRGLDNVMDAQRHIGNGHDQAYARTAKKQGLHHSAVLRKAHWQLTYTGLC
jgi:hypothetical protein